MEAVSDKTQNRVSAGELREKGWTCIPENIPDCATIRMGAWRVVDFSTEYDESTRMLNNSFSLVFTEPFRWIEGEFTVEENPNVSNE